MSRRLVPPDRFDLARTVGLLSLVPYDPTVVTGGDEAWWATHTPDGPGTLHLVRTGGDLIATGYGPGSGWVVERADAIAGLRDDISGFTEIAAGHPVVRRLSRLHAGLRLPATGQVFHHLVPTVLGQKVTREEARRAYHMMVRALSGPAPGPHPRLRLPPTAGALAASGYWVFHPFGVERRRAETIMRAAVRATQLEALLDAAAATRRLMAMPGIGEWTTAEVVRAAYGDPDIVTVGDYHLPNTVANALAGESRADDARMLELLEPFRGHRGRVCQLIMASGHRAPRFGPRMPVRPL